MLALVLDTSTPAVSAALVDVVDGTATVIAECVVVDARRHGELLAVGLQEVLRAGTPEVVVVGVGPGPFTGLRVGIVTAAAVADSLGINAVGVCSLDGLSAPHTGVVTDARRREVYWASYDGDGQRMNGPHVSAPSVAAQALLSCERIVGDGALLYPDAFGSPSADVLGTRSPDAFGRRSPGATGSRSPGATGSRSPGATGSRVAGPRFPSCARLAEVALTRMINGSSRVAADPLAPLPVPLIMGGGLPLTPLYLRRPDAVATADR